MKTVIKINGEKIGPMDFKVRRELNKASELELHSAGKDFDIGDRVEVWLDMVKVFEGTIYTITCKTAEYVAVAYDDLIKLRYKTHRITDPSQWGWYISAWEDPASAGVFLGEDVGTVVSALIANYFPNTFDITGIEKVGIVYDISDVKEMTIYEAVETLADMANAAIWLEPPISAGCLPRIYFRRITDLPRICTVEYGKEIAELDVKYDRFNVYDKVVVRARTPDGEEIEYTQGDGEYEYFIPIEKIWTEDDANRFASALLEALSQTELTGTIQLKEYYPTLKPGYKIRINAKFYGLENEEARILEVEHSLKGTKLEIGKYVPWERPLERSTWRYKSTEYLLDKPISPVEFDASNISACKDVDSNGVTYPYFYITFKRVPFAGGYLVEFRKESEEEWETINVAQSPMDPEIRTRIVEPGATYVFRACSYTRLERRTSWKPSASGVAVSALPDTSPPPVPTGLTVSGGQIGDWVVIEWDPLTVDDLDHFNVYFDGKKAAETRGTKIRLTPLPALVCGSHYVEVTSVDIYGNESGKSASAIIEDTTSPSAPTGLTISGGQVGDAILIEWDKNTEKDVSHYNVYFDGSKLVSVQGTKVQMAPIPLIACGPHYVEVTAVDECGHESDKSLSAIIEDTTPPSTPTNLKISAGISNLYITWDEVSEKDVAYYNVYVDKTSPASSLVGKTSSPNYLYTVKDSDYSLRYVRVKAEDRCGNKSDYSEEVSAYPLRAGVDDLKEEVGTKVGSMIDKSDSEKTVTFDAGGCDTACETSCQSDIEPL